jgi:hypothetical protein
MFSGRSSRWATFFSPEGYRNLAPGNARGWEPHWDLHPGGVPETIPTEGDQNSKSYANNSS